MNNHFRTVALYTSVHIFSTHPDIVDNLLIVGGGKSLMLSYKFLEVIKR